MEGVNLEGRELHRLSQKHRGEDGFPQWYRDRAGRYAALRRGQGAKWSTIACEVGVSAASLNLWMRAAFGNTTSKSEKSQEDLARSWSSEQERLQSLLQRHRKEGCLPSSVRQQLGAYALSRRGEGVTFRVIAQELGAAKSTVQSWCRKALPAENPGSLVPVIVEESAVPAVGLQGGSVPLALCVVTPKGFRIEGLGLEQIAQLLPVL